MLIVTVTLAPGGDISRSRILGEMKIANVSGLAAVSDYEVEVDEPAPGRERLSLCRGHRRSDGFWALVAKAIRAAGFLRGAR